MLYAGIKGLQQTQIFVAPAVVVPAPDPEQVAKPTQVAKPKSSPVKPIVDLSQDID
jgi:hypothetical protein